MKKLLIILVFICAGCPVDGDSSGPVDHCESIAEQCRLDEGQLGVCSIDDDGELACMPQH